MQQLLKFAHVPQTQAKCVIFGANTDKAGYAPSEAGNLAIKGAREKFFAANDLRLQDNVSPALAEHVRSTLSAYDSGNIDLPADDIGQVDAVAAQFLKILKSGKIPACLGGDHLIKAGGLKGALQHTKNLGVFYLDAHPDCRMGNELRYDTILHHSWQNGLKPENTAIIGLRQYTPEERDGFNKYQPHAVYGSEFGLGKSGEMIERLSKIYQKTDAIYVSIDLDGLCPADGGAVEQPYPGGPTLNETLHLLHGIAKIKPLIGLDISEYIPMLDARHVTALSAARILKEFCAITSGE